MTFVWRRCAVVAAIGVVCALAAWLVFPSSSAATLCLLSAGVALGELLVIRSDDRLGLPLSYAIFVVLSSSFDWRASVLATLVGFAIVAPLQTRTEHRSRVHLALHHLSVAMIALVAFRGAFALVGGHERLGVVLWALSCAVASMIVVDQVARVVLGYRSGFDDRGRRAWSAIASSGVLMAVGERGVDGIGHLGVWGAMLFAIPLLAAWFSFDRLDAAAIAHRQTIEALAMAPEHAGLVNPGHSDRVARLSVAIGRHLGFERADIDRLETAARLHHLGVVTLDDPAFGAAPVPASTVAHVTADMMRGIESLAAAGDIVARAGSRRSFTYLDARGNTAALALQYANAYDEAVCEQSLAPAIALQLLRFSAADCDERERSVIDALEFVALSRMTPGLVGAVL